MIFTKFSPVANAGLAQQPTRQTPGSTGLDVFAAKDVELKPFEPTFIGTAISIQIPEGFDLQLRLRSSLAAKGIVMLNGVGTIDSDYQGEIKLIVMNLTKEPITIKEFDRVGQLILAQYFEMELFRETLVDKRGGFGSTGR